MVLGKRGAHKQINKIMSFMGFWYWTFFSGLKEGPQVRLFASLVHPNVYHCTLYSWLTTQVPGTQRKRESEEHRRFLSSRGDNFLQPLKTIFNITIQYIIQYNTIQYIIIRIFWIKRHLQKNILKSNVLENMCSELYHWSILMGVKLHSFFGNE